MESIAGRIFLLLRAPEKANRCVLVVPAFGEEMNKSRRQITETAHALVERGFAVLLVDLFGTGDSEGSFAEASWEIWKSDVATAITWATATGLSVDALIATRLGCSLAAATLRDNDQTMATSIFWQPVESGRQFMTQFLRLRVAASMMEDDSKETVDRLRERLAAGERLSIAGYTLSSELWRAIDSLKLSSLLNPCLGELRLLEVGRAADGQLSASGRRLVTAAEDMRIPVLGERISGEPFWSSTEIVVNAKLTDLTVEHLTKELRE
jgi:exosortase A-associated hydrolase 2